MDHIECANCVQVLTADGPCPRCGSRERRVVTDLLVRAEIRETITMTFVAPIQIWTYLPAAIQSHLRTMAASQNDREIKALCLESVISTAVLVEGLVTDHIERELEFLLNRAANREPIQKWLDSLEFRNWRKKVELAHDALGWSVGEVDSADMIELLFKLRDQMSHGKSYKLADRRHFSDNKLQRSGSIVLVDGKYGGIYEGLSSRGILPPIELHPDINVEMFLVPKLAAAFFEHGVKFLRSFVRDIRLRDGVDVSCLLEQALR
jgi:hypothetical protein